jgi:valyl-tRNA synthetase
MADRAGFRLAHRQERAGHRAGAKLDAYLPEPSAATAAIIAANPAAIDRLARLSSIRFAPAPPARRCRSVAGDARIVVPLEA